MELVVGQKARNIQTTLETGKRVECGKNLFGTEKWKAIGQGVAHGSAVLNTVIVVGGMACCAAGIVSGNVAATSLGATMITSGCKGLSASADMAKNLGR